MTYLDGFGSLPQLATYSPDALRRLKAESMSKLLELIPLDTHDASFTYVPSHDPTNFIQLGSFAIPKGPRNPILHGFNLQAPTTRDNAMRVIRACQVSKPILLEGSPGVGKTSLITALANISGHELCRINLSDQTDLIDLFGSDLPVEGGGPGEFAWKDAEFLKALQEGHWVLLDEMNLAPQAVLEGLNAILDHRGTVYIPELGRSFTRHQNFRIFAAQNPLHQGGGRKGLPKSFVNRFTKVYVDELSSNDMVLVCRHLFPDRVVEVLRAMVTYNACLTEEIRVERTFAREGSPWEFNLRDVIRWGTLLRGGLSLHPVEYLRTVYLHRFRTLADRRCASSLFDKVFSTSAQQSERTPRLSMSSSHLQIGRFITQRKNTTPLARPGCILQRQLSALESIGHCVAQSWLAIVIGQHGTGKSNLIKVLAHSTGNPLREISVNSATDTMDILGSFEQVDNYGRVFAVIQDVISFFDHYLQSASGSKFSRNINSSSLRKRLHEFPALPSLLQMASSLLDELNNVGADSATQRQCLQAKIQDLLLPRDIAGRFEWVDGPLVRAMKLGHWVLIDHANLCSPSVLDRLNSLCEPNGVLVLSERGYVDGRVQIVQPHPNFRLFMSVDPHYGELSRAMRNRGIEIALSSDSNLEDQRRVQDHLRLPSAIFREGNLHTLSVEFEGARRAIFPQYQGRLDYSDIWPAGYALDQNSALSTVLEQTPLVVPSPQSVPTDGILYFFAHISSPAYLPHSIRVFAGLTSRANTRLSQLCALLERLSSLRSFSLIAELRENYSNAGGVSSEFTLTKVNCLLLGWTFSSFLQPPIIAAYGLLLELHSVP
jgi:midasin